jgi:hypothetical protein
MCSGHLSGGPCQKSAFLMPIFITRVEITWSRLIESAFPACRKNPFLTRTFVPFALADPDLPRFATPRQSQV